MCALVSLSYTIPRLQSYEKVLRTVSGMLQARRQRKPLQLLLRCLRLELLVAVLR